MCGRYAASSNPDDLVEEFEVEATDGPGPGEAPAAAQPDWNVAPTKPALVVLQRRPRASSDTAGSDGEAPAPPPEAVRWLRLLRWGLVPSWAKDPSVGARMINARSEGVLEKGSFRRAAAARRCLVPADGWYEWQVLPPVAPASGRGKPKPVKRPHFITATPEASGAPGVAFAGLYEFWRDASVPDPHDARAWLSTFTILTTAAAPELAHIHDRMPLVLPRERWQAWLDPDVGDPAAVAPLLTPLPAGSFTAYPVSTEVNSVANNGPQLLERQPEIDVATGEVLERPDALF
ncbi:MAG: SOS response-associated peptidase [Kineosporiaceae bacterium]